MRYKASVDIIADYEILQLQDLQTKNSLSLIPRLGANLNSFLVAGQEILWSANSLEQIESQSIAAYSGMQLFPFVNRIKAGKYKFQGKTYRLPINEPSLNNSLHGLVFDKEFMLLDVDEHAGSLKLGYNYNKDSNGYPFKVYLENTFQIFENSLTITTIIENKSRQTIPLGHGWHPYFTLGNSIDEAFLEIAATEYFIVDKQQIPTGDLLKYDKFQKLSKLSDTELDNCFPIKAKNGLAARLFYPKENLEIKLFTEGYPFLQIYTPADRKSIAIEPQTSAVNAFNNGIGNILLKPKSSISFKLRILVEKNDS